MSVAVETLEVPAATPEAAPVVLDVRNLSRSFGAFRAVTDVSFQVRAGEIFGFVGPNGAGKTTTLKMLATLDEPSAGDAFINGLSVSEQPGKARLLIGYMPDRAAAFKDVTVFESLDFFARAFGLKGSERRDRLQSVIQFTQLEGLKGKLLTELSKGMQQRVTLARTLLHDPALLLLDEPADGLDPRARIELRELLAMLAEAGKAIVISSHILTELSEMCDACAIIEQGRLLATGDIDSLVARPRQAGLDITVQLAGAPDLPRCERFLLEQPHVREASATSANALRVRFEGDDAAAHGLLKALVNADFPVCGFQARTPSLEDAFMHVTRGRVQ